MQKEKLYKERIHFKSNAFFNSFDSAIKAIEKANVNVIYVEDHNFTNQEKVDRLWMAYKSKRTEELKNLKNDKNSTRMDINFAKKEMLESKFAFLEIVKEKLKSYQEKHKYSFLNAISGGPAGEYSIINIEKTMRQMHKDRTNSANGQGLV